MITARSETLLEKPSFKQAVEKRRCLIPANGFYKWRREGNRKVPIVDSVQDPWAFCVSWTVGLLDRSWYPNQSCQKNWKHMKFQRLSIRQRMTHQNAFGAFPQDWQKRANFPSVTPLQPRVWSRLQVCLMNSRNIDRRRAPPHQRVMHSSALDAARRHSGLDGAAIGAGKTCSSASSKPVRVVLHRRRKLRLLCFAQTPVASRWVCVVLQPISFLAPLLRFFSETHSTESNRETSGIKTFSNRGKLGAFGRPFQRNMTIVPGGKAATCENFRYYCRHCVGESLT